MSLLLRGITTMRCGAAARWLDLYAGDDLRGWRKAFVARHVATCESCGRELERRRRLLGRVKSAAEQVPDFAGEDPAYWLELSKRLGPAPAARPLGLPRPALAGLALAAGVAVIAAVWFGFGARQPEMTGPGSGLVATADPETPGPPAQDAAGQDAPEQPGDAGQWPIRVTTVDAGGVSRPARAAYPLRQADRVVPENEPIEF